MSKHVCPKNQCACAEVQTLTDLYCELRNFREKAERKVIEEEKCGAEIHLTDDEKNDSQCNHMLKVVRKQRESVKELMTAIKDLNTKLSCQEEAACRADKEIADLQNEICLIKKKYDASKTIQKENDQSQKDENAWRLAVELETKEKCRLKEKMKEIAHNLEVQKCEEKMDNGEKQMERKIDAMLLLKAVNFVDKCIQCSKEKINQNQCR